MQKGYRFKISGKVAHTIFQKCFCSALQNTTKIPHAQFFGILVAKTNVEIHAPVHDVTKGAGLPWDITPLSLFSDRQWSCHLAGTKRQEQIAFFLCRSAIIVINAGFTIGAIFVAWEGV